MSAPPGSERWAPSGKYFRLLVLGIFGLVLYFSQPFRYPFDCKSSSGTAQGSRLLNLSTKTPYPHRTANDSESTGSANSLTMIQLHHISRHGARYPTEPSFDSINRVFNNFRPYVPQSWIKLELVDARLEGLLAHGAEKAIEGIARRAVDRNGGFLKQRLLEKPQSVRFLSSQWQRSKKTGKIFRNIVDPLGATQPLRAVPVEKDTTMAMRFSCPLYSHERQKSSLLVHQEVAKFDYIHGRSIQEKVSSRLAAISSAQVVPTMGEVSTMYSLCGYDQSLFANPHHWCTLFDPELTSLLELRNDIRYSHVYGPYGHQINKNIACALFTQIIHDIDQAERDPSNAVSTLRFAHAETIMFISTLLELENVLGSGNVPITGNMSLSDAAARGFKSTELVPFSSNMDIEVYEDGSSQLLFRLLLNERPIRLPGCLDDICHMDVLRKRLQGKIGCDFANICKLDSAKN
ncbi:hypothetical protein GGI07_003995 [Coemansia sp. Benny D115]|nr:hypothetical protein GGI07_003995 [Coemansia sp. Benny D115]